MPTASGGFFNYSTLSTTYCNAPRNYGYTGVTAITVKDPKCNQPCVTNIRTIKFSGVN